MGPAEPLHKVLHLRGSLHPSRRATASPKASGLITCLYRKDKWGGEEEEREEERGGEREMKETSSDQSLEELSLTHHRLAQSVSSVPSRWPPGCPPPPPAPAPSSPSPHPSLSLRIPCTTPLLFFALSFGQSQKASAFSWPYRGQTQTHCWTAQSCILVHLCKQKMATVRSPMESVHQR